MQPSILSPYLPTVVRVTEMNKQVLMSILASFLRQGMISILKKPLPTYLTKGWSSPV